MDSEVESLTIMDEADNMRQHTDIGTRGTSSMPIVNDADTRPQGSTKVGMQDASSAPRSHKRPRALIRKRHSSTEEYESDEIDEPVRKTRRPYMGTTVDTLSIPRSLKRPRQFISRRWNFTGESESDEPVRRKRRLFTSPIEQTGLAAFKHYPNERPPGSTSVREVTSPVDLPRLPGFESSATRLPIPASTAGQLSTGEDPEEEQEAEEEEEEEL